MASFVATVAATFGASSCAAGGAAANATEGTSHATASDEQALTFAWY